MQQWKREVDQAPAKPAPAPGKVSQGANQPKLALKTADFITLAAK
jgi:hypothetical protein